MTDPPRFTIPDSLTLQEACSGLSRSLLPIFDIRDTVSLKDFNRAMDSAATAIASYRIADKSVLKDSILAMVYTHWRITFDPRDTVLQTLLPHLVFQNKKGACLGVSLIILMLAQKLDCPISGVVAPGHFFCRYDDKTNRTNIEPNRAGFTHPDEYYLSQYPAAGMPWYDLDGLSGKETVGMLCYNAGVICLDRQRFGPALSLFNECTRRFPDFREAPANRALTFAKMGDLDSAMAGFEKLFREVPGLPHLAVNYGATALAVRDCAKALQIFKAGAAIYPSDERLLAGMAQAYACLGLKDSAKSTAAGMKRPS